MHQLSYFSHLWDEIFISLMDLSQALAITRTDNRTKTLIVHILAVQEASKKAQNIISRFIIVAVIESPPEIKDVGGILPGNLSKIHLSSTLIVSTFL